MLERLSLTSGLRREFLAPFTPRGPDGRRRYEGVVLSTCNRTEIYFTPVSTATEPDIPAVLRGLPPEFVPALSAHSGLTVPELAARLFRHDGWAAAEHLFRVVCGLDSLVAGESQIVGQVARAYAEAQEGGTAGVVLSTLFQSAIRGGRRARSRIGIGGSASNAGTAAVERAEKATGTLAGARAVVIGTGEVGRIVLQALRERGRGRVDIVSRTQERADEVAARWGCPAHSIAHLPELLRQCDVLFSTTGAAQPVVSAAMIGSAMAARGGRPLVLVDLGVPRTIDPAAASVPGVHLLDIDSLKDDPVSTMSPEEEQRVRLLIREDLAELRTRMAELSLRPVIRGMWQKAEVIRGEVLARARERLPDLDERSWAEVEDLASSLVARILHDPATRLRAQAGNGHAAEFAEALRALFRLGEPGGPLQ
jgi:glutamyl-tRNA reductase